jgi:hypothetical protein
MFGGVCAFAALANKNDAEAVKAAGMPSLWPL